MRRFRRAANARGADVHVDTNQRVGGQRSMPILDINLRIDPHLSTEWLWTPLPLIYGTQTRDWSSGKWHVTVRHGRAELRLASRIRTRILLLCSRLTLIGPPKMGDAASESIGQCCYVDGKQLVRKLVAIDQTTDEVSGRNQSESKLIRAECPPEMST